MERPTESNTEPFINKINAKEVKFRGMFTRAFMNIDDIERTYLDEGHVQNPERLISEIRNTAYKGRPLDPESREHVDGCRQCHRLLRYHKIRKGLYEQLGLDLSQ
jgi:hypothetical protein